MIRRLFRWAIYLFIILVVLAVAGILLMDTAAKSVAESQIRAQTGMDAKIGKFTVGLASPTITIEQMTLFNKAEFGGSPFVKLPELHVEYDRNALAQGRLHFKLIRLNLEELHVVEDEKGNTNVKDLEKLQKSSGAPSATNKSEAPLKFTGIDTLNLTIDKARFTSSRRPQQNREVKLGIKNEIFTGIKDEKDFQAVAMTLALRKGASFLVESALSNPGSLLQGLTNSSPDTKKLLEGLFPRK